MNLSEISDKSLAGKFLQSPLHPLTLRQRYRFFMGLKGRRWVVGSCDHGCRLGSYEYEKRRVGFLATHGCDVHQRGCRLLLASLGYWLQAIGENGIKHFDEVLAVLKTG